MSRGSNTSIATLNVDGSSQLNIGGWLYLRGNAGQVDPTNAGNNNYDNYAVLPAVYDLPLSTTAGNGLISVNGGITIADTSYNSISLTVGAGST